MILYILNRNVSEIIISFSRIESFILKFLSFSLRNPITQNKFLQTSFDFNHLKDAILF
ncbi:hypothetical protein LEP1GSC064_0776 [Leptospira kirschneri serovar Grippotyphosa str. Moskva]|uniref:Uncharacterized protein n=1 Tax=Leptospira kirschneri serovar Bulgarica str. Nikolaevo TaxID=1240687 RepID=M6F405_9LEPT|nr:hypothetical protein LEP1GSC044_0649 [Leptospira kirschneri serovar Grippotyphosa str. RM52]EKQ85435.1 hypothetical protein LEP1GSC064_0776 [Leptospira kirschneri serovar Grippotyphosa str. Moskva]EKR10280.1 hypothetical protein LEP1GSC122_0044 [Leptospira kirschneri serovar Valbuzzi str. 200702274]EMK05220.1 hypothetical protein LEP1GSC166_1081 [Leptospira kirschneri]EMK05699.1 hypothetical protein LEP1GSC176_2740 [Leptospira kirschneri str. MMD1493]EMK13105.1 hypothetical protein LEP1GSC0